MVVPADEEREKGAEGFSEKIIAENLPNLGNETDIEIQEAHRGAWVAHLVEFPAST